MKPVIVNSKHCHLWTDALHARQLAIEAKNKWDRGTYVRFCVTTVWIALEMSCQDALQANEIGYSFKKNLNKALQRNGFEAITWGAGLWQKVQELQDLRKNYVHRFADLSEMFPQPDVASNAIKVARAAIKDIYHRSEKDYPSWVDIDQIRGWETDSQIGTPTLAQAHEGMSFDDPNTRRIVIVRGGNEALTSVYPIGYDTSEAVDQLLRNLNVPIEAIRIYEAGELIEDNIVLMRGN